MRAAIFCFNIFLDNHRLDGRLCLYGFLFTAPGRCTPFTKGLQLGDELGHIGNGLVFRNVRNHMCQYIVHFLQQAEYLRACLNLTCTDVLYQRFNSM